jgi:hypothetical protein
MNSRWLCPTLALVLCGAPLAARADDYDQFRIPAHHVMRWDGSLGSTGDHSANSQDTPTNTGQGSSRAISGNASTSFLWLSDSDPRTTQVFARVRAATDGLWKSTATAAFGLEQSQSTDQRSGNEDWTVGLSHSAYPWASPLGFAVNVNAAGFYQQIWQHTDQEASDQVSGNSTVQLTADETWYYQTSIADAAQLRFGRVRNATGVYDARVLEQRLRETGALSRPLSPEGRRRLVALMYLSYDYDTFRERPGKSLWERVEEVLRDDGAVSDSGFDARAVQRAGESEVARGVSPDGLPRSPVMRLIGGYIAGEITDQHQSFVARVDAGFTSLQTIGGVPQPPLSYENHGRFQQPFDQVMAGGVVRYDRPLGDRWQVDAAGVVLAPLRPQDDGFQVSSNGAATMLISDRWFASLFWSQLRNVRRDTDTDITRDDSWQIQYGLNATWYIEDRLQLVAGATDLQESQNAWYSLGGPFNYFRHTQQFSLALTYRFMGSFAAPGLIPAENLAGPR